MRTIAVVTVGRSDFGIFVPVLRAIQADSRLRLHLIAAGGHLSPTFGWTVREIQQQGFEVADQVDMLLAADTPEGIAKSTGLGIVGLAQVYQRVKPDLLLVLGDRYDMLAAVVAAVPFKIPIAHIHGGEVTAGAIDEAFRHSITKCAHLHFASTEEHAARIVQLGEEPWRVTVSGAPGLDHLHHMEFLSKGELSARIGLPFDEPPLVVTYHPVTLQHEHTAVYIQELLAVLAEVTGPIVITKPNADTSGQVIIAHLESFAAARANVRLVDNLGTQAYLSIMRHAAAMVGNSSSGIIEAASFELPVVNIGIRQAGRPRSANVVDCGETRQEIGRALAQAVTPGFRQRLRGMRNIYGDGHAAAAIVARLASEPLNERLLVKRFHDLPRMLAASPLAASPLAASPLAAISATRVAIATNAPTTNAPTMNAVTLDSVALDAVTMDAIPYLEDALGPTTVCRPESDS